MKNNNHDENNKEDSLTLAKLVSSWYVGAIVGFAVGNLNGNSTTAIIGSVIGAIVSWIFKKWLISQK